MMVTRRIISALGISLLALALLAAGDEAARFSSLGHKLICPCGCNQILLECNHVGCTRSDGMRDELSQALTRGDSDDLILQAFVQKYGATILAAPPAVGFNRVAWIMPFAVLLAGFALAVMVVRSWRGVPLAAAAPPESPELDRYREKARRETEL